MNSLLTTLIDLMRISASISKNPSHLRVAPARDILIDICSPQVSQPNIDQLAQAIEACAFGRSATLPSLDLIEPALSSPECDARLARADIALNELLLLYHALHADAESPASLTVSNPYVFDYLQDVQISAAPHQPQVVLLGPLLPSQGKVDLRFESSAQLLKRLTISYSADSLYPWLDLGLGSTSVKDQWANDRTNYIQQPLPEYDLNLSLRSMMLGKISTRLIALPYVIGEKHITITFDDALKVKLLITNVLDKDGKVLVTGLRVQPRS